MAGTRTILDQDRLLLLLLAFPALFLVRFLSTIVTINFLLLLFLLLLAATAVVVRWWHRIVMFSFGDIVVGDEPESSREILALTTPTIYNTQ